MRTDNRNTPIGRYIFSFFCPVQPTAAHRPALAPRSRRGQVLCHRYSPSSNRQSFQSWRSNRPAFCPAQWVCAPAYPGQHTPFGGQKQHTHRAVDHILRVANTLYKILFLIDQRCHQFRGIDLAVVHFKEMGVRPIISSTIASALLIFPTVVMAKVP